MNNKLNLKTFLGRESESLTAVPSSDKKVKYISKWITLNYQYLLPEND